MLKLTVLFDKRKLLATGERLVLKQQRPTPPPPKNFHLATPGHPGSRITRTNSPTRVGMTRTAPTLQRAS